MTSKNGGLAVLVLEQSVLMARTKFGSAQAVLIEASGSVDGMLKRNRFSSLRTILMFVVFSIPMSMIFLFPAVNKTVNYGDLSMTLFVIILTTLTIVSPWAFLSMTIYFYKKQLKLQAYAATVLFFWAAATQMLFVLIRFLDYLSTYRYPWFHLN